MNDSPATLRIVRPPVLLPQLAAEALRDAILSGRLRPGARLIEGALAKEIGISRPSLREAISQLAAEKLVTMTPNRGATVTVITWEEAAEIYDVRALLEGEAGFRFARLATKLQIEAMQRALRRFKRAIAPSDMAKLVSTTAEFYEPLVEGAGNRVLRDLLSALNARIALLRAFSMSLDGRSHHSFDEMAQILDAVERRDAEEARTRCVFHVRQAAAAAHACFDKLARSELAG